MNSNELSVEKLEDINNIFVSAPYLKLIGMKLEKVERGSATVLVEDCEPLKQGAGVVHGGAIASMIDTAMAFSIMSLLDEGEETTTVDLTVHFLRPVTSGKITATAQVIRAGRKVITVSAEAFNEDEKLCATALTTCLRLTSNV